MNGSKNAFPEPFFLGLRAYNQHAFFEAHEHFEEAWRLHPGDEREFFRAFLQLSGGFYRLSQGRPGAARKFFAHTQKWIAHFSDNFHGFDVAELKVYLQELIDAIDNETQPEDILKNHFQPIQPE